MTAWSRSMGFCLHRNNSNGDNDNNNNYYYNSNWR